MRESKRGKEGATERKLINTSKCCTYVVPKIKNPCKHRGFRGNLEVPSGFEPL